jgi:periplasmic protein TonB
MSVAVHVLVALLLLIPAIAALIVHVTTVSSGSAGARGGGGGGSVLRGFIHERLRYVETPPSAPPTAPARPVPKPPPVVRPPEPKPPPPPTSAVPVHDSSAVAQNPGNGAGRDETGGAGPGTGGGTGAGVGTGTGNATGPATGGSVTATKIHAATDVMTVATIDPPSRPRPFHLHAVFAVDTRGNARLLTVNKADDSEFNRAMHERLMETHFKPATLPNGTPVADTVALDIDY